MKNKGKIEDNSLYTQKLRINEYFRHKDRVNKIVSEDRTRSISEQLQASKPAQLMSIRNLDKKLLAQRDVTVVNQVLLNKIVSIQRQGGDYGPKALKKYDKWESLIKPRNQAKRQKEQEKIQKENIHMAQRIFMQSQFTGREKIKKEVDEYLELKNRLSRFRKQVKFSFCHQIKQLPPVVNFQESWNKHNKKGGAKKKGKKKRSQSTQQNSGAGTQRSQTADRTIHKSYYAGISGQNEEKRENKIYEEQNLDNDNINKRGESMQTNRLQHHSQEQKTMKQLAHTYDIDKILAQQFKSNVSSYEDKQIENIKSFIQENNYLMDRNNNNKPKVKFQSMNNSVERKNKEQEQVEAPKSSVDLIYSFMANKK